MEACDQTSPIKVMLDLRPIISILIHQMLATITFTSAVNAAAATKRPLGDIVAMLFLS